jgi:hypothetical protein
VVVQGPGRRCTTTDGFISYRLLTPAGCVLYHSVPNVCQTWGGGLAAACCKSMWWGASAKPRSCMLVRQDVYQRVHLRSRWPR